MKNKIKISAFFWLLAAGLFACTRFENDELPSPANGPAKLNNDTYATAKNKPVQLVVLRNDTITTDGILMFGQPAHGAIISDTVGFTYYPQTSFVGTDSFYYKYCSATTCDSALVKVLVYDPEPGCTVAANHDQAAISSSAPVTFSILSNDNTCGPVTVQFLSLPKTGNAVLLQNNDVTYTPNAGFAGTDSLVYEIQSPDGRRATATVTIKGTANCTMQANPDAVTTIMNDSVTIFPVRNDVVCNAPSVKIITKPLYGLAQVLPNNSIAYQPGYNFVGGDVIEYEICNGNNQCSRSYISIQTQAPQVNCQTGFIARNDSIPLPAGSSATSFFFNVLANDTYCPHQLVSLSVIQPFALYGAATPVMHNGVMHLNYVKSSPPGLNYSDEIFYEIRMNLNGQIVSRTARVTVIFR